MRLAVALALLTFNGGSTAIYKVLENLNLRPSLYMKKFSLECDELRVTKEKKRSKCPEEDASDNSDIEDETHYGAGIL